MYGRNSTDPVRAPLRILHILDHSLPLHSGYAFRTLSILREQRALGWETFQLTTPKQGGCTGDEESVEGWRFLRTPLPSGWLTNVPGLGYVAHMSATSARLDAVVRTIRPHVLHAHSPVLNALPALHVGRRHRIPVVYELRSLWEDAAVEQGVTRDGSLRYRASRALETFALRHSDRVTTICEGLRGDILARGIPPQKVFVIPNGVDAQAFHMGATPDDSLGERLGLRGANVLGFAGSFYGYEGLDLLLDVLPGLISRIGSLKVLLVGGGPQEANLREQAIRLGVRDRVIFAGRVPHHQVGQFYDLMDVMVYPRRPMRLTHLVTPLKPLEAMAQGRMLVASDVGGHRELIRHGHTGVLFKAGDPDALSTAIENALSATYGRDDMLRRARHFVETERSWTRSVANYASAYAGIVEGACDAPRP
jgi:hypothetical protein